MLDTFKAQLKASATALGAKNLSNKRIDEYAAKLEKRFPNLTLDDDHQKEVDAFLELIDLKEVAAFDDYQRTKSQKDKKDTPAEPAKQEPPTSDTPAEPVSKTDQLLQELLNKVNNLEKEKQVQSMQQKLAQHEKLKGVPKEILDLIPAPEKEEEIDGYADKVSAAWEKVKPAGIQTTKVAGGSGGAGNAKPSKEQIDAVLQKI